jgi:hypothetical protein
MTRSARSGKNKLTNAESRKRSSISLFISKVQGDLDIVDVKQYKPIKFSCISHETNFTK